MEIRSIAKSVRMSPRKIRLVADAIRHMSIDDALDMLAASEKRAAIPLAKAFKSAVANAVNNAKLEKSSLVIESINITEGSSINTKRFHPASRGRTHPYKRRKSNIRIVLKQKVTRSVILSGAKSDLAKSKDLKETKKNDKKKGEK